MWWIAQCRGRETSTPLSSVSFCNELVVRRPLRIWAEVAYRAASSALDVVGNVQYLDLRETSQIRIILFTDHRTRE